MTEVEAVLDIENTFYSGVLPFHHEDKLGVHFGRIDNSSESEKGVSFIDPEGRDNYPAIVILPHAVWEAHDRPNKIVASFRFAIGGIPAALEGLEGVFLMVQRKDGSASEDKGSDKESQEEREDAEST